ncbi:50S ribosomal protein L30 [Jeotgalicoccus meleagridis]|jgi:large subunit ribosomal protein L30|uniref:Large ribosomal subunit protein uL30 n=1 Tax=Jeotgalicoccus meleagridis TaxID=2759181 RepID=A0A6V7R1L2_9STAP|nr:50S ribosomal protein L30 [Jeotgalicoccus meleagridis]CAD2070893.1 50S ribosomal protein L30 [Jeotgalicoccus meleagridis]HIW38560.1 50S ribosomal protein L30 [Candidatus Jeotgalicoccus stercoravium]
MAKVKVTLTKSMIGKPETQRQTVAALGLKKMHQTVEHEDTPQFRGQVAKVSHLVTVEEN